jgi:hypothetical protein
MKYNLKLIWFLCCCVFLGSEAFGRFDEIDADVIDQEERLSAASFHDANTYRFYPRFEKLWLSKDIGYRISDGSYDADRSRIHEQIKVSTPPEDTLRFSYARDHYHDLVDRISNDEIRLTWKPVWGLYVAGLADGTSSYKQWGDLGAAFGWMRDRSSFIELYQWSVDHFYNSKAEVDLGVYNGKPQSTGLRINWEERGLVFLRLNYEKDKPFKWLRDDCACVYSYAWSRVDYVLQTPSLRPLTLELKGASSFKSESKEWDSGVTRSFSKTMAQHNSRHEFSLLYPRPDISYYQLGAIRIERFADYEFDFDNIPSTYTFPEDPSPDASHREIIAFLMFNTPMDDANRYFFQSGFTQNWVSINRELRDEDIAGKSDVNIDLFKERFLDEASIEQKFQFAFELHLKENFWVFLNATLDVDGIRREFPYRESPTPGEIWDGGGVQLMAVF